MENLEFGFVLAEHGVIETLTRRRHECSTAIGAILQGHGDLLIGSKGNADDLIEPRAEFEIFIAGGIEGLKAVIFGEDHGLDVGGKFQRQEIEHETETVIVRGGTMLQCLDHLVLFVLHEGLELSDLGINRVFFYGSGQKRDKPLNHFGLFLHIVFFRDHGVGGFTKGHDKGLDIGCNFLGLVLFFLFLFCLIFLCLFVLRFVFFFLILICFVLRILVLFGVFGFFVFRLLGLFGLYLFRLLRLLRLLGLFRLFGLL